MIPVNTVFPKFVPDQLLTSEDLNQLFGYLDEQGRMTRTNLIGIGIVCGLEVKTNPSGTSITISRGCGVTSEGYLITVAEKTYSKRIDFDPVKPKYYEKFVDLSTTAKKFDLWELKEAGVTEGTTDLNLSFLNEGEKVVMLFVELLEEDNKNCNPNSCDDKGINVTITFRPLLVSKQDVVDFGLLIPTGNLGSGDFTGLKELHMPRFDVPNTHPINSLHIFNAFKNVLSQTFLTNTENALADAYDIFSPFVEDEYASNPFAGFASGYAFLNNNSITPQQTLHLQYYYDLFADFLATYEEFRKEGSYILSLCVPDSSLFPRHLLLGEAVPGTGPSTFRHYFIYSPLFEKTKMMSRLKSLFHRLVLLRERFLVPLSLVPTTGAETPLRITPSKYGELPLSFKSIPYYYQVNVAPKPLFQYWDFDKTRIGNASKNLSYHAALYNITDEYVYQPLLYDMEPYNFLRIEGHIGKQYLPVLQNIQQIKDTYRLPFEVVALKATEFDKSLINTADVKCGMQDLELSYDIARREYEAVIGLTIEWLDDNRTAAARFINTRRNRRLEKFIQQLVKVKQYMVDDLAQFIRVYGTFFNTYEFIETEAEAIRELLVNKQEEDAEIDHSFLEDLVDHFDDVLMTTKKGAFRALKQEFDKRFSDLYAHQFFSYYAQHHPSLQHKAGVTMGGTFILVYHQTSKKGIGNELVDSLANGTVIADFFLPYMCCSDCPPVRFEFPNPENPKLTLALQVNPATNTHEYCQSDKGPYKFTASPDGGTLQPMDGVNTEADGTWTFIPAALEPQLGNNDKIEKDFVYTKDGQSSSVLKAIVYHLPKADFTANPSSAGPGIIILNNLSKYATQYEWNFGDGNTSTAEEPGTHTYATAGTYVITLKAANIPGCGDGTERSITVEFPIQKTCESLEEIIGDFNGLDALPAPLAEPFKQIFEQYPEVEAYFKRLLDLIGKPVQKQIDFFGTTSVIELLTKWLSELDLLIKESDVRLPALYLYRVLVRLAEYIACIQPEDINQAKLPMLPVFELIMRHLNGWKEMGINFNPADSSQLARMKQEAQTERARLTSGEQKQLYQDVLDKLIEMLSDFGV
jgi:inhibitor of KinA sporulation pathway (predicted exonuclease)